MSEADTPSPGADPQKPVRTVVARTVAGSVVRWAAPPAESLSDSFPGLKVRALCGVGGMGAVYRAEQARLGRTVAVKILPVSITPDDEARERFEREARILSGMSHPNVLGIHDFGALEDGTLYLVMEWAAGGDLAKLLDGKGHPVAKVQAWVRQIAAALTAAHARGIIHRDLKPANVLVLEDGRLTLADFGLAHAQGGGFTTALTNVGALFGTFEYMAPEQMESAGKVTPATDIYALGVITYQMLTGRVPRGAYARASRLSRVPSEVDVFLDSALANDPAKRPKNALEFSRLFDRACNAPRRRIRRQLVGLGITLVVFTLAWARAEIIRAEREAARAEATAARVAEALTAATLARQDERNEPKPEPVMAPEPESAMPQAPVPVLEPEPVATPLSSSAAPEPAPAPVVDAPPPVEIVATPEPTPVPPVVETKPEIAPVPWTWVLPEVKPGEQTLAGEWKMARGELVSGDGRCALTLPVKLAINYDVAVEFTRNAGKNSVAVFLPTLSGVGVFEVDAWDLGIAGLQLIDGEDMRRQSRFFPARLKNGETHRLIIEVRGDQVAVNWDGEPRMTWSLTDRRLRIAPLWQIKPEVGLGVGSWMSPTTFHRIAYRSWPADMGK